MKSFIFFFIWKKIVTYIPNRTPISLLCILYLKYNLQRCRHTHEILFLFLSCARGYTNTWNNAWLKMQGRIIFVRKYVFKLSIKAVDNYKGETTTHVHYNIPWFHTIRGRLMKIIQFKVEGTLFHIFLFNSSVKNHLERKVGTIDMILAIL